MKRRLVLFVAIVCAFAGALLAGCGSDTACDHGNATSAVTAEATCEKDGVMTFTCPDCNETWTAPIPALGHDYVLSAENSVEATCTTVGRSVELCARCGESRVTAIPQLEHNYTVTSSRTATCTDIGYTEEECSICHDVKKTFISAANHTWVGSDCEGKHCSVCGIDVPAVSSHRYQVKSRTEATCEDDGVETYECSLCHKTYDKTLPAVGHTYFVEKESGQYTQVREGECTYETSHTLKCMRCKATKEETYTVENRHDFVTKVTQEPTCTTDGVLETACSVCHTVKESTALKDLEAHNWIKDGEENGLVSYHCEYNGEHHKTSIEAAANAMDVQVTKDAIRQATEVTVGGASIAMDSDAKESLPDGADLTLGVAVADKASEINPALRDTVANDIYNITLSAAGSDENITSFGDGTVTVRIPYELKDGDDVNAIVIWYIEGTELVPIEGTYSNGYVTFTTSHFSYYTVGKYTPEQMCEKYGHFELEREQAASCTESGYKIIVCTRCGEMIFEESRAPLGHKFEKVEADSHPASCTENGLEKQKCANCEATIELVLPALGHVWVKGDSTEATCDHSGSENYACANCESEYHITIPQRSHLFLTEKKAATCTEGGFTRYTCSYCGYSYEGDKTAPTGHSWNRYVPTCGEGQVCTVCGETGAPATGEHTYKDGVCSVCGAGCDHDFKVTQDIPSTCFKAGYTVSACTKCGVEKKGEYKPLGAHDYGTDGVCTVCGKRDESAAQFYKVFLKSLAATRYTLSLDPSTSVVLRFLYDGRDRREIQEIKTFEATLNIGEDGKPLFSVHILFTTTEHELLLDPEDSDSYSDALPPVSSETLKGETTMELYAISDGTFVYTRETEDGETDYWKDYMSDQQSEPMKTIFAILREEAVLNYLTDVGNANNNLISSLLSTAMTSLFAQQKTGKGGYDLVLKRETMLALNEDLNTLSVQALADKYLGVGVLDELIQKARSLMMDMKMSEAIGEIFKIANEYHIERKSIISLVESMIFKFTNKQQNIEELLGDPAYAEYTYAQYIERESGLPEGSFKKNFEESVAQFKNDSSSVYDSIGKTYRFDSSIIYQAVKDGFGDGVTSVIFHTDEAGKAVSLDVVLKGFSICVYRDDSDEQRLYIDGALHAEFSGEEVTYDREFDVLTAPLDSIRALCRENGGTFTQTYTSRKTEYSTTTTDVYTYVWTLNGDVLSVSCTHECTRVNNNRTVTRPGEGTTEYGSVNIECDVIENVGNAELGIYSDCDGWIGYRIRVSSDNRTAGNCYNTYRYYDFERQYDLSGKLVSEKKTYESQYKDPYASFYFYYNEGRGLFRPESQHVSVVDTEHTTTEDDVNCEEYYYTYYVCSKCHETLSVYARYKSHINVQTVKLMDGADSCEDGVIVTTTCAREGCDRHEERESHEHVTVTEREFLQFPHGENCLDYIHCACGAVSDVRFDSYGTNGEGCHFASYDPDPATTARGKLYVYRCVVEDCTAAYTVEEWEEVNGCDVTHYSIYRFYDRYDEAGNDRHAIGKLSAHQDGYRDLSHLTRHAVGEGQNETTYYTLEENGYTGFRTVTSYKGCEHTGPYAEIEEFRYNDNDQIIYQEHSWTGKNPYSNIETWEYDEIGREILHQTRSEGTNVESISWTRTEYKSLTSCECTITYHESDGYEFSEDTVHHGSRILHYISSTCTQFGYRREVCEICGDTRYTYQYNGPMDHYFYNGTCTRCGLESKQGNSGLLVLEDMTQYGSEAADYVVGVWNREKVSNITLEMYLVYLTEDGEEETVKFDGNYRTEYRVDPKVLAPYDCYLILVDRNAVKASIDANKQFVGLRLTFIPTNSLNYEVTSITLTDPTSGIALEKLCEVQAREYALEAEKHSGV